jgi:hypothetical protein
MSSLTFVEKNTVEKLLGMSSGYVLNLSDRQFEDFFRTTVSIDINEPKYQKLGSSKAKRLRCFWDLESDNKTGLILDQLLQLWLNSQDDEFKATRNREYQQSKSLTDRLLQRVTTTKNAEQKFLNTDFNSICISNLPIEPTLMPILENRLKEATLCLSNDCPLASVIVTGSLMEGLLLAFAQHQPLKFNQSRSAPLDKKTGKTLGFHAWTLSNFIDVSYEVGLIKKDIKDFSHSVRSFRNYIHPYEQRQNGFNPDKHTAEICLQVLKALIYDLANLR